MLANEELGLSQRFFGRRSARAETISTLAPLRARAENALDDSQPPKVSHPPRQVLGVLRVPSKHIMILKQRIIDDLHPHQFPALSRKPHTHLPTIPPLRNFPPALDFPPPTPSRMSPHLRRRHLILTLLILDHPRQDRPLATRYVDSGALRETGSGAVGRVVCAEEGRL